MRPTPRNLAISRGPQGGRRAKPPPLKLRPLKAAYMAGARVTRALPAGPRYSIAAFGCTLWRALDPGRRRNARANYAAALGLPESDPRVDQVAGKAFANYGRMLADFLLMGSMSSEEVRAIVDVEGYEHVAPVMARGRGAILALPHMGSWDFAAALATVIGHRLAAVAETFPGSLDEAVVETRTRHGLEVIPMGRAAVRAINQVLDENGMVALLCDLPQGPGSEVRFFGRRAVVPSGPAAIACRRRAPILPVYSRRL